MAGEELSGPGGGRPLVSSGYISSQLELPRLTSHDQTTDENIWISRYHNDNITELHCSCSPSPVWRRTVISDKQSTCNSAFN